MWGDAWEMSEILNVKETKIHSVRKQWEPFLQEEKLQLSLWGLFSSLWVSAKETIEAEEWRRKEDCNARIVVNIKWKSHFEVLFHHNVLVFGSFSSH